MRIFEEETNVNEFYQWFFLYYYDKVPTSSGEEKERFIRNKYETKEFLAPLNPNIPIGQQLIESVVKWVNLLHIIFMA